MNPLVAPMQPHKTPPVHPGIPSRVLAHATHRKGPACTRVPSPDLSAPASPRVLQHLPKCSSTP